MTKADFLALLPLLILTGTSVVAMLAIALRRSHFATALLTITGLAAALAAVGPAISGGGRVIMTGGTSILVMDRYAMFYIALIVTAALIVAMLSYDYFRKRPGHAEEYYVLLAIATMGSAVMVASNHLVSFFLGLEILSVSLYSLIAYERERRNAIEAGIKYLVLAGASSAFLLFGMALVYADTGTMSLARLAAASAAGELHGIVVLAGLGMIIIGAGFKLALAPFHLWTPDVYEGAPAPVTAFVATVSKGAMFALVLRYFAGLNLQDYPVLVAVFSLLAVASMLAGNLLALRQHNVKRILAYSSIAHLGYIVVAFVASGRLAVAAVSYYLVAYFVTSLGAFGVVSYLSTAERDADDMEDYRGLAWRRPAVAALMTAMLLSLAGIPLTAGFVGKFYVLAAGVNSGLWALAGVLVIGSTIGLFYYLRIVAMMYRPAAAAASGGRWPLLACAALAATLIAMLMLGIYPSPMIEAIGALAADIL